MIINGNRTKNNPEYRIIYSKWKNMMERVYNPNNSNYNNYGGAGVTVCKKWQTLDGFIDDFDKINGYNYDKLINHELCLDKDMTDINNKEYCLEKCSLIPITDNNKYKPNQQYPITAINPNGIMYIFGNQSEFAKAHGLRQSSIADCLSGKCKTHKK